jgi:hypothetical protein
MASTPQKKRLNTGAALPAKRRTKKASAEAKSAPDPMNLTKIAGKTKEGAMNGHPYRKRFQLVKAMAAIGLVGHSSLAFYVLDVTMNFFCTNKLKTTVANNSQNLSICFPSDNSLVAPAVDQIDFSKGTSIFHLHIQKAGGTALATALSSSLCHCPENKKRKYVPGECECERVTASNGQNVSVLQSRLTTGWECGVHPWLSQVSGCKHHRNLTIGGVHDDVAIVTFIRDPLHRVLSEYRWCKKSDGTGFGCLGWDWVYHGQLEISKFVKLNNSYPFQNRQMKMLSGCPSDSNWMDEQVCKKCLEAAKDNVKKFALVGVEEASPFFLQQAGALIGKNLTSPHIDVHRFDPQTNYTKISAQNLSVTTVSSIVRNNEYDYKLYNFTRKFLCQKYRRGEASVSD